MAPRESAKLMPDHDVTKTLSEKNATPFRPFTRNHVLNALEISRVQFRNSGYKNADQAIDEIEKKYDL